MIRALVGATVLLVVLYASGSTIALPSDRENNVCPTFDDYYTVKNNSRCWYDPSAEYVAVSIIKNTIFPKLNFFVQPEIMTVLGYPVETYKVATRDGYILTMYRIPNDGSKNPDAKKHPVYMQHGLVATSNNFLALQRDSLGE